MNKFWEIFKKVKIKPIEFKPCPVPDYIIYNVENFNNWYNATDNNAEYAHKGIFLRLDKLSISQVNDYIVKCYGIISILEYQKDIEFLKEIQKDWRDKLNKKHFYDKIQKKIKGS